MKDLEQLGIRGRLASSLKSHEPPINNAKDLRAFKKRGVHWTEIDGVGPAGAREIEQVLSREEAGHTEEGTKKYEKIAAYSFGVIFICFILGAAIFIPQPTPFQYEVFKIVLALSSAGVSSFIPGFLSVTVGMIVRAGGALAVFAIIYFFSPAQLAVEAPKKYDGVAMYFDIRFVGADDKQTRVALESIAEQIVKKYGLVSNEEMLLLPKDRVSALNIARKAFADLVTSTPEISQQLSVIRIGLAEGEIVRYKSKVSGPAVSSAKHVSQDEYLDEIGLQYGIFVDHSLYENLTKDIREEFSIASLHVEGVDKVIYRVHPGTNSPVGDLSKLRVVKTIKNHSDVYMVCFSFLSAMLKKNATEEEISAALANLVSNRIDSLVVKANIYEGHFPGLVNILLFENLSEAVKSSEYFLTAVESIDDWDELLSMSPKAAIHKGAVVIQDDAFAGEDIATLKELCKQEAPAGFITISAKARDAHSFSSERGMIPGRGTTGDSFYFFNPSNKSNDLTSHSTRPPSSAGEL